MTSILVDANILCLIVAGNARPSAIGKHKKLKAYSRDDFKAVIEITEDFSSAVTCSHILTETSNLLAATHEEERRILLGGLARIVSTSQERLIPALSVCESPFFYRLGLTDAVLLTADLTDAVLLTADLNLTFAARAAGRRVINYNWVRDGMDWRDQL